MSEIKYGFPVKRGGYTPEDDKWFMDHKHETSGMAWGGWDKRVW